MLAPPIHRNRKMRECVWFSLAKFLVVHNMQQQKSNKTDEHASPGKVSVWGMCNVFPLVFKAGWNYILWGPDYWSMESSALSIHFLLDP